MILGEASGHLARLDDIFRISRGGQGGYGIVAHPAQSKGEPLEALGDDGRFQKLRLRPEMTARDVWDRFSQRVGNRDSRVFAVGPLVAQGAGADSQSKRPRGADFTLSAKRPFPYIMKSLPSTSPDVPLGKTNFGSYIAHPTDGSNQLVREYM